MCDLSTLDEASREKYHTLLNGYAEKLGGKNFFLQLLEDIREEKPHPLLAKNSEFVFSYGSVKWNKAIFKDKIDLLQKIRIHESEQDNLLPPKDDKSYKKVMNLLRTIKPIVFTVWPREIKGAKPFYFQALTIVDEERALLNPIFDAIFFCSIDTIKKLLNDRPKDK
jgi:hypothetical protein